MNLSEDSSDDEPTKTAPKPKVVKVPVIAQESDSESEEVEDFSNSELLAQIWTNLQSVNNDLSAAQNEASRSNETKSEQSAPEIGNCLHFFCI